jgi:ribosomal protein L29
MVMPLPKASELRKLSSEELEKKLDELWLEVLKFKQSAPQKARALRRVRARILTILRERTKG